MKFIWVVRYHDTVNGMDIERDERVDHTCALYERDSSECEDTGNMTVIVSLFAMNGNKVVGVADVIKQRLEDKFDNGTPVPKHFQNKITEYYNFQ
tara:strand:+ start:2736 stop:3020 length:285 start_codon:yes stop_codon:yes gene_type:complete